MEGSDIVYPVTHMDLQGLDGSMGRCRGDMLVARLGDTLVARLATVCFFGLHGCCDWYSHVMRDPETSSGYSRLHTTYTRGGKDDQEYEPMEHGIGLSSLGMRLSYMCTVNHTRIIPSRSLCVSFQLLLQINNSSQM